MLEVGFSERMEADPSAPGIAAEETGKTRRNTAKKRNGADKCKRAPATSDEVVPQGMLKNPETIYLGMAAEPPASKSPIGRAFGTIIADSVHPLSTCGRPIFPAGNEEIFRQDVAQEVVGGFGYPNPWRGADRLRAEAILADPQA